MNDSIDPTTDDERLGALLDGELSEAEARALRERLEQEPALARRYAALQRGDRALREALSAGDADPMPEGVLALLRDGARAGEESAGADNVRPLHPASAASGPASAESRQPRAGRVPLAMAASVALLAGFGLAQLWPALRLSAPAPTLELTAAATVERGSPLYEPLNELGSGATVTLQGAEFTPRLTFRSVDGDACRLVDLRHGQGLTQAVLCRDGAQWRVDLAAFRPAAPPGDEGLFRPATGGDAALERALDALIDGDPLGPDDEQALIGRDWQD